MRKPASNEWHTVKKGESVQEKTEVIAFRPDEQSLIVASPATQPGKPF